jgi:hypothetical protein
MSSDSSGLPVDPSQDPQDHQDTKGPNAPKRKASVQAIVFVVISILGFVFYALYDKQVFPAASIDIKLLQADAAEKSRLMAVSLGYDVDHSKHVTTFAEDDDAKTVLEFKLGIDKANQLMKSQVPVWLWRTRYCKELSKDELVVAWTTQGQFKSIFHTFENDKKLPTISQDDALALAKQFVAKTAAMDLTDYELFDQGSEKKPNRVDHHFIWRKPGFTESEFRIRVDVSGNEVSTCRYWLSPTDTWTREYKGIRQWNELLGNTASLLLFLFIAATIGAFIHGISKHDIRWRFTLISSGIVAVLVLLESLNNFNYSLEEYNTSISYSQFLMQTGLFYLLGSLGAFVTSVLIVGGAEVVYRSTRPAHMAMENLFTFRGMAQKDYSRKTIMGYLLVGVMMFWAIGYYKIGQKFGYFCPLGVDDYKVLGNFCPAISGALIGVSAAGLEEFTCRVVGLGLLQKWTKSFWIANLLQAMIWGFAHSNYPQEPCYARGVELTVVGLLFGYIVRTCGVLPCLIAHYLYDAFLTVQPVFSSHQPLLIIPSILILLPFIGAVWYSRNWSASKKLDVETIDLTNAGDVGPPPVEHPAHIEEAVPAYTALTGSRRKQLLLLFGLCLITLFIPSRDQIGKDKQILVPASKAIEMAGKYVTDDGLDQKGFQSVAQLLTRPDSSQDTVLTWQHVYEQLGLQKTTALYDQVVAGLEWEVRFFKPLDPQSYKVYLNGDGSKRCIDIDNIDEAPGAKLDEASAQALVESYIRKNRPEFVPFTLDNKSHTVQAKRIDYKFDFVVPKYAAGDTPAILHAEIQGDKVSDVALDWRVPDNWLWPRKQPQGFQQAVQMGRIAALLGLLVAGLWWCVHLIRITRVPWRLALGAGLTWAAIALVGVLNGTSHSLINYDTAETFESFVGQTLAMDATRCLLQTIGCLFVSIIGLTALQQAFPSTRQQLHSWFLLRPATAEARLVRTNIWLDAAISSYAFCALFMALRMIQTIILSHFSPTIPLDIPGRLAGLYCTTVPVVTVLGNISAWMIGAPVGFIVIASFWQRFLTSKVISISLILVAAILLGVDSWYWQNSLVDSLFTLVRLLVVLFFVRKIFATNALAYMFVVGEIISAFQLSELIAHASKIGGLEIAVLAVLIVAPAVLALLFWRLDLDRAKAPIQ